MSPKNSLNKEDVKQWLHNTLVFLAPALAVLIASTVRIIPPDWKYGTITLYVLNVLTDLLRKYTKGA